MNQLQTKINRYLIPMAISVVIGFLFWIYAGDKNEALIIAMLSNLTFLFVEHFQVISRVSKYIDLYGTSVDASDSIFQLAAQFRRVEEHGDVVTNWIASCAVGRLRENMATLVHGRWTVRSYEGFVELAQHLFDRLSKGQCYSGTSIVKDYKDYWNTSLGKSFHDASVSAMARGVRIQRVFIFQSAEDVEVLQGLMQKQAESGIEVRYLIESERPIDTPLLDFGVWHERTSVELMESRYQGVEFRAYFHFNQSDVDRLLSVFKSLFDAAKPVSTPPAKNSTSAMP